VLSGLARNAKAILARACQAFDVASELGSLRDRVTALRIRWRVGGSILRSNPCARGRQPLAPVARSRAVEFGDHVPERDWLDAPLAIGVRVGDRLKLVLGFGLSSSGA
jgi:hypothetical protein